MFGLVFSKWRDEEQPWWDDDPETRARNLSTELALSRHMHNVLNLNGGDPEDGRDGRGDKQMHPLLSLLKYGGLSGLSAMGAWLIYMGVTDWAPVTRKSLQVLELHAQETSQRMDRMDRTQDRIVNLLLAQCVNSAKNRQSVDDCIKAAR